MRVKPTSARANEDRVSSMISLRRVSCAPPTDTFCQFREEDVEQSITSVFAQQVARYRDRIAVKTRSEALTYDALDVAADLVARAIGVHSHACSSRPVALLFGQ